MSTDIVQIINLLLLVGIIVCIIFFVTSARRAAKALEDIAKDVHELAQRK